VIPPLRVIRTAAEPRARALGAPPPPCRRTTSWEPMIAKLAGVVPKVTLSNPSGSVTPVPGKTESFAPMLLALLFRDYLAQPLRFNRRVPWDRGYCGAFWPSFLISAAFIPQETVSLRLPPPFYTTFALCFHPPHMGSASHVLFHRFLVHPFIDHACSGISMI